MPTSAFCVNQTTKLPAVLFVVVVLAVVSVPSVLSFAKNIEITKPQQRCQGPSDDSKSDHSKSDLSPSDHSKDQLNEWGASLGRAVAAAIHTGTNANVTSIRDSMDAGALGPIGGGVMAKAVEHSVRHRGAATDRRLRASMVRLLDPAVSNFTVVVFGGSTTTHGHYPRRIWAWLTATFPGKKIRLYNAAIGATGGDMPSFCLDKMVAELDSADLVLTEFSMNPTSGAHALRLYSRIHGLPHSPPIIAIDFANGYTDPRPTVLNWGGMANQEPVKQAIADNITVISTTAAAAPFWTDKRDGDTKPLSPWSHRTIGPFHNGKGGFVDGDGYHPSRICHLWMAHFVIEYVAAAAVAAAALVPETVATSPAKEASSVSARKRELNGQGGIGNGICLTDFVLNGSPLAIHRVSGPANGAARGMCLSNATEGASPAGTLRQGRSEPPRGCDWRADADENNANKRYLSTGSDPGVVGAWVEFEATPGVDCVPYLGFMLSDKLKLGSADVSVDGVNLTRVIVDADKVPFTIQSMAMIPTLLHNGQRSVIRVTVADSPPRTPRAEQYSSGHRFIVTGLYC